MLIDRIKGNWVCNFSGGDHNKFIHHLRADIAILPGLMLTKKLFTFWRFTGSEVSNTYTMRLVSRKKLAVRREVVHCAVEPMNEGFYLLYCQQFPSLNAVYGMAIHGVKQGDNVARLVT